MVVSAETGRSSGSTPGWVELQAGRYGSVPWRLMAREQHHTLCLALTSTFPDDPAPAADAASAGGCGFDDRPGGGYFTSGPGPAGVISSFGPVPARATAIRVARDQTIPTFAFPAGHGLPAGRYWLFIPPASWPDATSGPVTDPQPLDDRGNPVEFTRF
jgi:hypothetical protein